MKKRSQEKRNFVYKNKLHNPGLKTYLHSVVVGDSDIVFTPMFNLTDDNKSDESRLEQLLQLLDKWMKELETLGDKWPTLLQFEKDLAEKVGPMSVRKPLKERMQDIEAYYDCISLQSEAINPLALKEVLREWRQVRGLTPMSIRTSANNTKMSTNSGLPYFTKRKAVVDKTLRSMDNLSELNSHWTTQPAILGWRGQEGGHSVSDTKQRVVWMFPLETNIYENCVYKPLVTAAQRFKLVPAWGSMDDVDREITLMFDTKGEEDLVVCTDFSKFDQHFNAAMQEGARYLLQHMLNSSKEADHWLKFVFPTKYNIPLLYALDKIRRGDHGMASGSGGTNADETIAHRALQYEAALSQGQKLNPHSQCLGDDGILTYPGITAESVMRSYTAHGLEMNESKQYVSKLDCTYLRRWHHKDYRVDGVCVGVYSTARALGRLCLQERFFDSDKWSREMVALRQLSILENIKYHPLKEQFVDFMIKGDKYRFGLDIPGFFDNLAIKAKEATDLIERFLRLHTYTER